MSDTQNGSYESIDTSPLGHSINYPSHELSIILVDRRSTRSNASPCKPATLRTPRPPRDGKPYLAPSPGATPTGAAAGRRTWYWQDIALTNNGASMEHP